MLYLPYKKRDKHNILRFLFQKLCIFKKSANLLEIQPKLVLIQNFDGFALILLFFEIFCRGKISQKIKMKKK